MGLTRSARRRRGSSALAGLADKPISTRRSRPEKFAGARAEVERHQRSRQAFAIAVMLGVRQLRRLAGVQAACGVQEEQAT